MPTKARDKARDVLERLQNQQIDTIFDEGLHEFLTLFITDIGDVAALVHQDYLQGGA